MGDTGKGVSGAAEHASSVQHLVHYCLAKANGPAPLFDVQQTQATRSDTYVGLQFECI